MRSHFAEAAIALVLLAALAGVVPGDARPGSSWPTVESRLPPRQSFEGFGHGSLLNFSQAGHSFQVFVGLGDGAPRPLHRRALEVVSSLHTTQPPLANDRKTLLLGRSEQGRPIRAIHFGDFSSGRRILVVGCIHGTECAGIRITQALAGEATRANLWVIHNLNPDGLHAGTRTNANGVDLNRNFANGWQRIGRPGSPQYSGPRPFSARETRIVRNLIERIRPRITIWYHQHADLVRAWGQSIPAARRYARLAGLRFRRMRWLAGTAPNWQNHHLHGTSSFVVELPPGTLTRAEARRHANAVLKLAAG